MIWSNEKTLGTVIVNHEFICSKTMLVSGPAPRIASSFLRRKARSEMVLQHRLPVSLYTTWFWGKV
ncbi:hypothetical protein PG996_011730 [Apiospora saccharicola]|uniref:Uncharacterized protein n=1 Tax=Apiospora saccharicola TaxID=335842 RepID=A0ABR1UFX0_9PEZI